MKNHPRYPQPQPAALPGQSRIVQIEARDQFIRERVMMANARILKTFVTMERANALVDKITQSFA